MGRAKEKARVMGRVTAKETEKARVKETGLEV
jgi:hypothetical protein